MDANPQSELGDANGVVELARVRYPAGFYFGFSQRCFFASLTVEGSADLADLSGRLSRAAADHVVDRPGAGAAGNMASTPAMTLLDVLVRTTAGLQEAAGITVARGAGLISRKAGKGKRREFQVAIPSLLPESAAQALRWTIALANALATEHGRDRLVEAEEASLAALMQALRRAAPPGNNVCHWIRAALDLGIPVRSLPLDIFQFGYGRHARLFQGSGTEALSQIGAKLALNKFASAALLRAAEIPVPDHELAGSPDEAAAAAQNLGFPVVVKPADQARGAGVFAGLASEAEVRAAWERAREHSPIVMVERHIEGKEYRLLVVNGRLFWAYERIPARVTGNGKASVAELVEKANRSRRPGPSTGHALVSIVLDEEALEVLAGQGLKPDSVPKKGQLVRLQRAPSNAGGGEILAVFDEVHSDNRLAAERAAKLLRVDVAGVDFLTPDIARSWRETGGMIIEVNSQPQISPRSRPDIHRALLRELMHGEGRVPVAIVLGDTGEIEAEVEKLFAGAGIRAGIASPRGIRAGEALLAERDADALRGARTLILDSSVDAIVLFADGKAMLRNGLPFERIDLLAIAGPVECDLTEFLALARPHITGGIVAMGELPERAAIAEAAGKLSLRLVENGPDLAKLLARRLALQARGKQRQGREV
jgi:cyanophycin synthetase